MSVHLGRFPPSPQWSLDARVGAVTVVMALAALTVGLQLSLGEDGIAAAATLYLVVVLLVAAGWGYVVGIGTAIGADLLLNFFFTSPVHTFTVRDPSAVVALAAFLLAAVLAAAVVSALRRQIDLASQRRDELAVMLNLSRELALAPTPERAIEVLAWPAMHALKATGCDVLENCELVAVYPATLLKAQGMTHILTVAQDLNATLRELPGIDLAAELSAFITGENITHVTLLFTIHRRTRFLARPGLANTLLAHHPRLQMHLVGRTP